jgi:hypothetical protein
MNVRTITIALIALPVVAIIGNAIIVREVSAGLATGRGTSTNVAAAKVGTEQIAADSRRGRAVGSARSGRDAVAGRAVVGHQVSTKGRLTPIEPLVAIPSSLPKNALTEVAAQQQQ